MQKRIIEKKETWFRSLPSLHIGEEAKVRGKKTTNTDEKLVPVNTNCYWKVIFLPPRLKSV